MRGTNAATFFGATIPVRARSIVDVLMIAASLLLIQSMLCSFRVTYSFLHKVRFIRVFHHYNNGHQSNKTSLSSQCDALHREDNERI